MPTRAWPQKWLIVRHILQLGLVITIDIVPATNCIDCFAGVFVGWFQQLSSQRLTAFLWLQFSRDLGQRRPSNGIVGISSFSPSGSTFIHERAIDHYAGIINTPIINQERWVCVRMAIINNSSANPSAASSEYNRGWKEKNKLVSRVVWNSQADL